MKIRLEAIDGYDPKPVLIGEREIEANALECTLKLHLGSLAQIAIFRWSHLSDDGTEVFNLERIEDVYLPDGTKQKPSVAFARANSRRKIAVEIK